MNLLRSRRKNWGRKIAVHIPASIFLPAASWQAPLASRPCSPAMNREWERGSPNRRVRPSGSRRVGDRRSGSWAGLAVSRVESRPSSREIHPARPGRRDFAFCPRLDRRRPCARGGVHRIEPGAHQAQRGRGRGGLSSFAFSFQQNVRRAWENLSRGAGRPPRPASLNAA